MEDMQIDYAKYKGLAEKYLMASVIELMKDRDNLYYGYFLAETKKFQNYEVQSFRTMITIKGIQLEYNPIFVVRTYETAGPEGLLCRLVVELNHLTLLHLEAGPMIAAFAEGLGHPDVLAAVAMDVAANYYVKNKVAITCPMCAPQQWDIDHNNEYRACLERHLASREVSMCRQNPDGSPVSMPACHLCNGTKVMFGMDEWAVKYPHSDVSSVHNITRGQDGIGIIRDIVAADDDTRRALISYMSTYQLSVPKADKDVSQAVANSIVKSTVHHIMSSKGVTKSGGGILAQFMEKIKPVSVSYIMTLKGMLSASMGTGKVATRYRPNRRFGYKYPGKRSFPKMKYIVAIDTSGSVSPKEVAEVLGELLALKQFSTEVECRVILFHHEVWADIDLETFDLEEFSVKFQSGGTDFDCVLRRVFSGATADQETRRRPVEAEDQLTGHREIVAAEQQAMLVMMTDGYCGISFDKQKVQGRIVWLITKGGTKRDVLNWDANAEVLELN